MDESKQFYDHNLRKKELFHRSLYYLKPFKKSFIIGFILIAFNVAVDIILPLFQGRIIDLISVKNPNHDVLIGIIGFSLSYIILAIVNQLFLYLESKIFTKAGQKMIYNLRLDVFKHIESLSQNQFNDMALGALTTRVCNYTSSMSTFFTNILVIVLKNINMILFTYVIMLCLSWKLGLIMTTFSIIIFLLYFRFSHISHMFFTKERYRLSTLSAFINEALNGMKIVQIFNQENKFEKKFLLENNDYRKSKYAIFLANGIFRPIITFIYACSLVTILYFGLRLHLTVGVIVSFYIYLDYFFHPVEELADKLSEISKTITNAERLFNLLDVPPDVIDLENALEKDNFEGKIEFRHVYFAYEKQNWILKDVSFTILPKETVAFIGATGAGKTTILSLITRNYEIQKGEILIDDINIKDIKIDCLRKGIGQMLQDVFLFRGTIKDNVTLFDESFSDQEVINSLDYVGAMDFINANDEGIKYQVLEGGGNFSTGQKQLISFARTVLHKPNIMILDEATAHIDAETELKIQSSLAKMRNIGTMLIVAHRLSTIQHSDKIIVLSHGEIVEEGNHQSLLKKKGLYYKLYKFQFNEKK